jgi:predicted dienelactone hydrolase
MTAAMLQISFGYGGHTALTLAKALVRGRVKATRRHIAEDIR